jgi:hypothetical protein
MPASAEVVSQGAAVSNELSIVIAAYVILRCAVYRRRKVESLGIWQMSI